VNGPIFRHLGNSDYYSTPSTETSDTDFARRKMQEAP
jgi:hypothetical protein